MNVREINSLLINGNIDQSGLFPHLDELNTAPVIFHFDFGLPELPTQSGLIQIRGPRQYGKSTWLEQQAYLSAREYGSASTFYLNGDWIADADVLTNELHILNNLFHRDATVRRIFIDEITAIDNWEKAVKRLFDAGELKNVLLVTTGSKATDLRRGAERLPGRKGRLKRTQYLFTPVPYKEFKRVMGDELKEYTLFGYMLTGGCPMAAIALVNEKHLPTYVTATIRDWVFGECAASGRQRATLITLMQTLMRFATTPIGQAKIAREAGLANNTVAAGYLELLADLMIVGISGSWDASRNVVQSRRPAKFPFVNLLAAIAFSANAPNTVKAFANMPHEILGKYFEWLVAQELWSRAAVRGDDVPEHLPFWQTKKHELDFVINSKKFIEVKHGQASAFEFSWFVQTFPHAQLLVINKDKFTAGNISGVTMEQFLLEHEV
ncbi:MAG: ATP-binding protein [Deltaproteobacteria bacterium]|nr:ATP-binding protein [Deltaproteobacteria bacterium]